MARMLPEVKTLEQHQKQLQDDPTAYRPERVPTGGKATCSTFTPQSGQ
jgi:hypothetical protein